MKNYILIIFVLLRCLSGLGQENSFSKYDFAYYQNRELNISTLKGQISFFGKDIKVKKRNKYQTSDYYTYSTMPKEVLSSIQFSEGMGFYSALKSPYDEKTWLFIERNISNTSYNLCFYDHFSKVKKIIFSEKTSPNSGFAFNPFAWSDSADVVYLEAIIFGSATENEGIWSYNFVTHKYSKLLINSSYLTTPVISPDEKYFIYTGTSHLFKNIHSRPDIIFLYDIQKNEEKIIIKDKDGWLFISGWVDKNIKKNDILGISDEDFSINKKKVLSNNPSEIQQPSFKLPWQSGTSYCVSRTGSGATFTFPANCPAPSCGPYTGDHGYQAIDFTLPLNTNVLAAASGTVVFAWFNANGIQTPAGGFGNLVKIRHSDNTYTYYAHFNNIGVHVGDVISQGCIIGKSGTTGSSTGPHLHFERRDVNDARFTINSEWPIFTEYNCTPNQNKLYTSQNNMQSCTSNFSLNCSVAMPITCGQSINGQTEGKVSSLNNQIIGDYSNVSSNPYTTWNDPGPEDVYQISVSSGATFTASLSNMASSLDLDVFILSGCSNTINPGNVTVTSTSATITNAVGGTYYILVDGYQNEYPAGSGLYGSYGSYTLTVTGNCGSNCTAPSTQSSNITFSGVQTNQMTVNWTNGNGLGRIVVAKAGSAITGNPANGTSYTGSTTFGSGQIIATGEYVVYSGTGSGPITVTNLAPGTTYHFRVFEYNCSGSNIVYRTSTASGNPSSQATSNSCPDNFETNDNCASATNVFASPLGSGTSNYTPAGTNIGYAGDQDWFRVQLIACGTLTLTLSNLPYDYDLELYGAGCLSQFINGSYNGGTNNEQIVFTSTTSNLTTLYVKVYAFNPSEYTTATCYNLNFAWASSTCPCTTPGTQASNISFLGIGQNTITANWINGNGSRRVVYVNTNNSFTAPANGTDPTANTTYTSGQQCVYNGSGSSVSVSGLTCGTTYYFRVYEANCTGASSVYNTGTGTLNPNNQITSPCCTAPTTQANNIIFSGIGTTSMTANWSNGNGSRRVVYVNTTNSFTAPANGTDPVANTTYTSGQQCVYNSSGNSVSVNGLICGTTYYFRVYDANCTGTSSVYNTGTGTNNPNNQITSACCTAPTTQANSITFSGITTTSMTVSWTNGNGSRRVVYVNTTNSFTAPPNGTDPTANTTYSGGQQCVYNGSGSSVSVSGLACGTLYYFRAYEANCTGTSSVYNTGTGTLNPNSQSTTSTCCTTPTIQTSNISFSSIGANSMTANWSNGNGSRRVVYVNTTNSFTAPANGTDPMANTTYTGGQQCVYNGSGSSSVSVSGLACVTLYYFRVYEANCSGSSSLYNTSTAILNPNSQSTSACCTSPTTQAVNLTFSAIGTTSMTAGWTNGNGSRRVVYINTTNSFTDPSNGTDPTANSTYTGGQQCIYNGSSNNVSVSGLSCATLYYFRVYEANCSASSSVYNTSTATLNPNSQITGSCTGCTIPTLQAAISSTAPTTNQITVNIVPGNGTRRLVKINTINNFNDPATGSDPSANSVYSGAGEQVVFNGNGSNVIVSGLIPATNYCFRIYEANCSGSSSVYNVSGLSTICQRTDVGTAVPNIDGLEEFVIIPNPNDGIFTVKMKLNVVREVHFRLINMLGQTLYESPTWHLSGAQTKQIALSNSPAGYYLLETRIGKEMFSSPIVIVR